MFSLSLISHLITENFCNLNISVYFFMYGKTFPRENWVLLEQVKKSKKMMGVRKLEVLGTFTSAMLHLSVTPKSVNAESTICTKRQRRR